MANYTYPVSGPSVTAMLPDLSDPANIVTAFQEYHNDVANAIILKSNIASPTFTGTATFPTISSGNLTATTLVTLPANTSIGSVSATEIGYLDGLTSSVQTQINNIITASAAVPTGAIMMWYTDTAPTGWIFCRGQSTTEYTALAAVVGVNVPNLQGRVPVGKDTAGTFATVGATGGSETVTLIEANLPAHSHTINHDHASTTTGSDTHSHSGSTGSAGSHTHTVSDGGSGAVTVGTSGTTTGVADNISTTRTTSSNGSHTHSVSIGNNTHDHSVNIPSYTGSSGLTGSGTAINNLQPYIVLNYIIKT
jgi:microcystin-dependent protein